MIDKGLLSRAKQLYTAAAPKGVLLSDVLAIIQHESGGNPVFLGSEPLFRMNTNMATSWRGDNGIETSGASSGEIRAVMVIANGPLKGMWTKFRFERVYWHEWAHPLALEHPDAKITPAQQVLLASSIGLGQQMIRFVVEGVPANKMVVRAQQFMGDVTEQIDWVIGNLVRHVHSNRQLMLTRYNLPSAVKNGRTYDTYGKTVMALALRIDEWLKEQNHGT